jgi:small subunit ribosomal protein S17
MAEQDAGEQSVPAAPEPEAPAPAPVPPAPAEVLSPKERRQRARDAKAAKTPARAQRSPEDRQTERLADRARKAELRRRERQRARAKASAARTPVAATAPREHAPGVQKTRRGVVVSDRADKTITVRIDIARRHRRYEKIVRTSRTLHVHDERNDAHVGDTVVVRESRPLSRTKHWRLLEIVERAQ